MATPAGLVPILAIDRSVAKPLYRQVYEALRGAIAEPTPASGSAPALDA